MKKLLALMLALCAVLCLTPAAFAASDGWTQEDGGWRYYQNGVPLQGVRWLESEGNRYLFDGSGLLQTGDAEGDVLVNGNLYYINPQKNLSDPKTCYAVRNYTRSRGQSVGITYYDADGITFEGWIKDAGGSLRYQTRLAKESIPGASKDLYIYVWRAQPILEARPDPDYPNDRAKDIPAGWYLFDDNGVLLRNANQYVTEGVSYTTDASGRITAPALSLPGAPSAPQPAPPSRPMISDMEGSGLTVQQTAEAFQTANAGTNQTVLNMTNQYRAEAGSAPLTLDEKMCVAATVRAIEMAQSGVFSHTRPNGTSCFTIFEDCGWSIVQMRAMGENIACSHGYADPDREACIGWRNSPGHYRNMISSDFTKLGVGKCIAANGYIYYVQLFASGSPQ